MFALNDMLDLFLNFIAALWSLITEMAPFLLLGFFIAGVLKLVLPEKLLNNYLKRNNWLSILKATLIGIPLPICSCGVIPLAAHLHKNRIDKGSVMAFLVTTPTTGVDSLFATYAMLGGLFTLVRLFATFILGIMAGLLVYLFDSKLALSQEHIKTEAVALGSDKQELGCYQKLRAICQYAFGDLVDDNIRWLWFGMIIGAFISFIVPDMFVTKYLASPVAAYTAMLIIGLPTYVCSTGSIPIAYSLIAKGMSPGAALVFLLTGPATNTATITFVAAKLGKKSLGIYLGVLTFGSIVAGLFLDFLWLGTGLNPLTHLHQTEILPYWLKSLSGFFLVFLTILSIYRHKKASPKLGNSNKNCQFDITNVAERSQVSVCPHCAESRPDTKSEKGLE